MKMPHGGYRFREENEKPVCDICGQEITTDYYELDGELICEDCLDDYIERAKVVFRYE